MVGMAVIMFHFECLRKGTVNFCLLSTLTVGATGNAVLRELLSQTGCLSELVSWTLGIPLLTKCYFLLGLVCIRWLSYASDVIPRRLVWWSLVFFSQCSSTVCGLWGWWLFSLSNLHGPFFKDDSLSPCMRVMWLLSIQTTPHYQHATRCH